jgi:hypothetical protein
MILPLEIKFLRKYSQNDSENIRLTISAHLIWLSKKSWHLAEELAGNIIKHFCSEELLNKICGALLRNRPDEFKDKPTDVETEILGLFVEVDELREYWCKEFIAKFSRKTPQILIKLVRERAKKKKQLYNQKDIFKKVFPDWKKRADFPILFQTVVSWSNQGTQLNILAGEVLGTFYDDDVLQNVKNSVRPESADTIKRAAVIASTFPKDKDVIDLFAWLLQIAEPHGEDVFNKVTREFQSTTWQEARIRSIGQPSNFHINIKEQCERILKSKALSRKVRRIFENSLDAMEQAIKNNLEQDKEMFE